MTTEKDKQTLRDRLAKNIVRIRTRQRLTQEELCALSGFHKSYISQVERAATNITIDNVEKIALALNVDAVNLFKA